MRILMWIMFQHNGKFTNKKNMKISRYAVLSHITTSHFTRSALPGICLFKYAVQ